MKGRELFLPLVAAAAVLVAGCGVSAAQEGTTEEGAEGGSSGSGGARQIFRTDSR